MDKKINYYELFTKLTSGIDPNNKPRLLLHSCCAPCSSTSLERVLPYFKVDVFYYNPNITSRREYDYRLEEQKRFVLAFCPEVKVIDGAYEPERFYEIAAGLEAVPEGGERCFKCYNLRLRKTAVMAKELGYDYFATTLTLSPLKNAAVINQNGFAIQSEIGVNYLPTDFKKKDGYRRSIELSKEYGLYRQNYCGCDFSVR